MAARRSRRRKTAAWGAQEQRRTVVEALGEMTRTDIGGWCGRRKRKRCEGVVERLAAGDERKGGHKSGSGKVSHATPSCSVYSRRRIPGEHKLVAVLRSGHGTRVRALVPTLPWSAVEANQGDSSAGAAAPPQPADPPARDAPEVDYFQTSPTHRDSNNRRLRPPRQLPPACASSGAV